MNVSGSYPSRYRGGFWKNNGGLTFMPRSAGCIRLPSWGPLSGRGCLVATFVSTTLPTSVCIPVRSCTASLSNSVRSVLASTDSFDRFAMLSLIFNTLASIVFLQLISLSISAIRRVHLGYGVRLVSFLSVGTVGCASLSASTVRCAPHLHHVSYRTIPFRDIIVILGCSAMRTSRVLRF